MARNKSVDAIRSEVARKRREGYDASARITVDFDGSIFKAEETARIKVLLSELPEPRREAVTAAFYGECSYTEAAEGLGIPEGTFKSRVRAGLAQLKHLLSQPVEAAGSERSRQGLGVARVSAEIRQDA